MGASSKYRAVDYVPPLAVKDRVMLVSSTGEHGLAHIVAVAPDAFVVRDCKGRTLRRRRNSVFFAPHYTQIQKKLLVIRESRKNPMLRELLGLPAYVGTEGMRR